MLHFVSFGLYSPDAPFYNSPAFGPTGYSPTATNVLATATTNAGGIITASYGPFPSFSSYSNALNSRCQGGYSMFSQAGTVNLFAATATKLYNLLVSSTSWTDVSARTYTTDPESFWSFTSLGDTLVASNFNDAVQTMNVGVDTLFSDLAPGNVPSLTITTPGTGYTSAPTITISGGGGSGATATCTVASGGIATTTMTAKGSGYTSTPTVSLSGGGGSGGVLTATWAPPAPRARYIATIRDFLVCASTVDAVDGTRTQRVWWSAIGAPATWPTRGSNTAAQLLSDAQDIWGSHGQIRGIFAGIGRADGVIVFERSVYEMVFTGAPAIFSFTPVVGASGTYAPKSIVRAQGVLYYYGENGFVSFDGSNTTSIGNNRVDRKILSECDPAYIDRIVGTADPIRKLVYWSYPGTSSTNGLCNTILAYNYELDAWSSASVTTEFLMPSITFGFTLEGLAALYPNLDLMTTSLDSPVFASNNFIFGGFDSNHKLGYFSGAPMTPLVDTPLFVYGDGDKVSTDARAAVMAARPVFDGIGANATVSIGSRENFNAPITYSTPVATNAYGTCPSRVSGRQFTVRISTTGGAFNSLVGVELDLVPVGRR